MTKYKIRSMTPPEIESVRVNNSAGHLKLAIPKAGKKE